MDNKSNHEVEITTHDRLFRAWENSMELVRDFQDYSEEMKDDKKLAKIFGEFAEDEAIHASKFRELLIRYPGK